MDYTNENKLLTLEEVADILRVNVETVARYTKREVFPLKSIYLNPDGKREPRVKVSDLKDFIQSLEDPRQDI